MTKPSSYSEYAHYINDFSLKQSKTSYTTFTFNVKPTKIYQATGFNVIATEYRIPYGSQLDFQVEAQVGHPSQR
jgi:hypothetical protein